jgi:hypothetical protein
MEPDELDEEDTNEDTEGAEDTQSVTQHARARKRLHPGRNAAARQAQALDYRAKGHTLEEVARLCGYSHKSVARRAILSACRAIAEDTAEEMRLAFKASYGPVRVALHRKARLGDVNAVLALVRLDEREAKLFGLDLTPDALANSANYTKRIILEEWTPTPALMPSENGHHNGDLPGAIWGEGGYKAQHLND